MNVCLINYFKMKPVGSLHFGSSDFLGRRWNVIAEEMARIDADSHKSPLADMVLDDD